MEEAKNNISRLNHCYGCGVCVAACPVKIIEFEANKDGFYAPIIKNQDKCINCGICLSVCAFNHFDVAQTEGDIKTYAGWSKDELVRLRCSSGGIGFELGRKFLSEGFLACGVRFNPQNNRAEHYIASTIEEFMPSVGSKYIPSFSSKAFSEIKKDKRYFITGTPCQIDSFRRYIRHKGIEQNFVLMDFFCHGVPSLLLWDKYSSEVENQIGKITFASWRNKTAGWHDSWAICADTDYESIDWHDSYNLKIKEKKHFYQSRMSKGDLFYKFFLGNYCLNKCCYKECKYKMCSSAADIRIGDLWGTKYAQDSFGTSVIVAFTRKGKSLIEELSESVITLIPESISTSTEGQMAACPSMPWIRKIVLKKLRSPMTLIQIRNSTLKLYSLFIIPKRIINKVIRIIKLK